MSGNSSTNQTPPANIRPIQVLLTRPAAQTDRLATLLTQSGFEVFSLPMLDLSAVTDAGQVETVKSRIQQLGDRDLAIFISSNAVNYTAAFMSQSALPWPATLPCLGIGTATNQAIIEQGWPLLNNDSADSGQSSEALLESSVLSAVKGQRISIFRGVGGRELLADTLRARGASVEYCESYIRHYPKYDKATLLAALGLPTSVVADNEETPIKSRTEKKPAKSTVKDRANEVNAILFASGETLDNFYQQLKDNALPAKLMSVPIIVPSPRLKQLAADYGFNTIITAHNASAEGFLQALKDYFN